ETIRDRTDSEDRGGRSSPSGLCCTVCVLYIFSHVDEHADSRFTHFVEAKLPSHDTDYVLKLCSISISISISIKLERVYGGWGGEATHHHHHL
uniref:Uncharacterized protein n=1 Tax=Gasterosteus aculeatus TaxID=69293 RepID=G3QCF3_GASAC